MKLTIIFSLLILLSGMSNASAKLTAESWIVTDASGAMLAGQNTTDSRSIASITKLVTAMVVLDAKQDLDERIVQYTRREMIQLAMVKSDNLQSARLCEHYPGRNTACILAMNKKVRSLGLTNTRFTDATGLGLMNVSTATDLVKLVIAAQHYPEIVNASQTAEIKIHMKRKWLIFKNTNPIIGRRHTFIVSKTGYIRAAGGCIVMMLDTEVGRRIVVVLGSKNTHTRIPEAEFIATHY